MTDSHDDDRKDDRDDAIEVDKSQPGDDTEDYEVGYGRPPKPNQFVKGQSGNPKGRKRGARGLKTDLKAELNSRVAVTENGKTKNLTKQQLVLKAMVAKAAKGDTKAASQVLSMTMQMFGIEDQRGAKADLSYSELAILESYLGGDVSSLGLSDQSPNEPPEPQAGVSGNGNHNNLNTTTVPDEESDDEHARQLSLCRSPESACLCGRTGTA